MKHAGKKTAFHHAWMPPKVVRLNVRHRISALLAYDILRMLGAYSFCLCLTLVHKQKDRYVFKQMCAYKRQD